MKQLLTLLIIILLTFSVTANNENKKWLEKIEKYFNEHDNCESNFEQTNSLGEISTGHFYLKRKKRCMKLVYDEPNPHILIVSNNRLIHYDKELKEKTETSIYSSPLSFFLDKILDLQHNIKIVDILERDDLIAIKLSKIKDDDSGAIMLIFSKKPFELISWIIFYDKNNDYGRYTKIELKNPKYNSNFPDKVFKTFS